MRLNKYTLLKFNPLFLYLKYLFRLSFINPSLFETHCKRFLKNTLFNFIYFHFSFSFFVFYTGQLR